jgi:phosphatidylglycerol---prolipoprotein diacylglyceryl transferase
VQPILARFEVLGWEVILPAYGTFLVLAALVAGVMAVRAATGPGMGLSRGRAVVLVAGSVVAGLIGARLLDVVLDWGAYALEPGRITALEPAGFALAGGFVGACAAALALARWFGASPGALADGVVPAVAAGLVLIRIGCFLNGCCPGEPTSLPWGVTFPYGSTAWSNQVLSGESGVLGLVGNVKPVHPAQLYEAGAAVLCAVVAVWVGRRGAPLGAAALLFATGLLAFRILNGAIRPDTPGATLPHELLLAGYAMAAAVAGLLLVARVRHGSPAPLARGFTPAEAPR